MMTMILRPLFLSLFVLSQTVALAPLQAAQPSAVGHRDMSVSFPLVVAAVRDTSSVLGLLALGGARGEDFNAIRADILKQSGDQQKMRLEMRGNEFYFDGAASGLKVSSYEPFRVTYEGRAWTVDSQKSVRDNYFSFTKFFSGGQHAKLSFINQAYAQNYRKGWAAGGAAVGGVIAGGVLYVIGAPVTVPTTLLVLGVAAVGGVVGYWHGRKIDVKIQNTAVDELLKAKVNVTCNDDRVQLSATTPHGSYAIRIEKGDKKHPTKISRNFSMKSLYDSDVNQPTSKNSTFVDTLELTAAQNQALAPLLTCDTIDGYNRICGKSASDSCLVDKNMTTENRARCFDQLSKNTNAGACSFPNQLKSSYLTLLGAMQASNAPVGAHSSGTGN